MMHTESFSIVRHVHWMLANTKPKIYQIAVRDIAADMTTVNLQSIHVCWIVLYARPEGTQSEWYCHPSISGSSEVLSSARI